MQLAIISERAFRISDIKIFGITVFLCLKKNLLQRESEALAKVKSITLGAETFAGRKYREY